MIAGVALKTDPSLVIRKLEMLATAVHRTKPRQALGTNFLAGPLEPGWTICRHIHDTLAVPSSLHNIIEGSSQVSHLAPA